MSQSNTYSSRVTCSNCGAQERIDIPKGSPIKSQPCPTCGCKTLSKAMFAGSY